MTMISQYIFTIVLVAEKKMVFVHAAIALELIALTGGAFLLLKTHQEGSSCKNCVKGIAYFVIVLATLTLFCSAWNLFFNNTEKFAFEQQVQAPQATGARVQPNSFANDATNQIVLQRNRIARQQQEDVAH